MEGVTKLKVKVEIKEIISALVTNWLYIILITAVFGVGAYVYTRFLPSMYTSSVLINPPSMSEARSGVGSAFGLGSSLARSDIEISSAILRSRGVRDYVIQNMKLIQHYHVDNKYAARGILSANTVMAPDPRTSFMEIRVSDTSPQMAADIANFYVVGLGWLISNNALARVQAKKQFFLEEIQNADKQLELAHKNLREFSEKHGILAGNQAQILLGLSTSFQTQLLTLDTQLKSMQRYATDNNPDYLQLKQQISSIEAQLKNINGAGNTNSADGDSTIQVPVNLAPEYAHQYMALMRDYAFRQELYSIIMKQLEYLKIDETSDLDPLSIQIIDKAEAVTSRTSPNVNKIVGTGVVSGLIAALVLFLLLNCKKIIKLEKSTVVPEENGRLR